MNYSDLWNISNRTLRFSVGEVALVARTDEPQYFNTPCQVMERGPFRCPGCGGIHDYVVKLCDGAERSCQDGDLKKFQPPADEKTETESEDLELGVTA